MTASWTYDPWVRLEATTGAVTSAFGRFSPVALLPGTDGGPAFDCAAGVAATLIPGVSQGIVGRLGAQYGNEVARLATAAAANLGFGASTAALARDLRCRT